MQDLGIGELLGACGPGSIGSRILALVRPVAHLRQASTAMMIGAFGGYRFDCLRSLSRSQLGLCSWQKNTPAGTSGTPCSLHLLHAPPLASARSQCKH